jgi:two-component system alkaline phosphatase synthesis response regulator PhoP/two-component system response regulator VicR
MTVESSRSPRRILVVEDDSIILRQIEFNLQAHGYTVETAATGVEALRRMLLNRPDLLITDVMMPEMDGYELVATMRRDPQLSEVPVIMLTARTEEEDMVQGYVSGTDLYLTKPFNPTELIAFAERILR